MLLRVRKVRHESDDTSDMHSDQPLEKGADTLPTRVKHKARAPSVPSEPMEEHPSSLPDERENGGKEPQRILRNTNPAPWSDYSSPNPSR